MPRAKGDGNGSLEAAAEPVENAQAGATEAIDEGGEDRSDMVATVATVAVVGVAAAVFEVALLPGIVSGGRSRRCAAIFSKDRRGIEPTLQVDGARRLQAQATRRAK